MYVFHEFSHFMRASAICLPLSGQCFLHRFAIGSPDSFGQLFTTSQTNSFFLFWIRFGPMPSHFLSPDFVVFFFSSVDLLVSSSISAAAAAQA